MCFFPETYVQLRQSYRTILQYLQKRDPAEFQGHDDRQIKEAQSVLPGNVNCTDIVLQDEKEYVI